jgi:hypothetical protein
VADGRWRLRWAGQARKKRYHKRASTGNWGQDSLTPMEKLAYKRTMGFGHAHPVETLEVAGTTE